MQFYSVGWEYIEHRSQKKYSKIFLYKDWNQLNCEQIDPARAVNVLIIKSSICLVFFTMGNYILILVLKVIAKKIIISYFIPRLSCPELTSERRKCIVGFISNNPSVLCAFISFFSCKVCYVSTKQHPKLM